MMNIFNKLLAKARKRSDGEETEVAAAIATALAYYEGNGIHDKESYIITIRRR